MPRYGARPEQARPERMTEQEAQQDARHFDVLIAGAGISGIGGAYHLTTQCPGKTFVVLDMQESFGGTSWTHRYPGIRSDSDLHTFGYRFKPWRGPPIATAAEILAYMGEVIAENDLARHIRYRHRIAAGVARFRGELAAQHDTDLIHLLFNNTGISGGGSFVADAPEQWEKTFNVCWGGVYHCTRALMPMLRQADAAPASWHWSINGVHAGPTVMRIHGIARRSKGAGGAGRELTAVASEKARADALFNHHQAALLFAVERINRGKQTPRLNQPWSVALIDIQHEHQVLGFEIAADR